MNLADSMPQIILIEQEHYQEMCASYLTKSKEAGILSLPF